MSETPRILTAEQMRAWYGTFYDQSPMIKLDPSKVPPRFWHLLPYAELWGVADDCLRENLVTDAPSAVRQNLRDVVMPFDRVSTTGSQGPRPTRRNHPKSTSHIPRCAWLRTFMIFTSRKVA